MIFNRLILFLSVVLVSVQLTAQTCQGFSMSGIKCTRPEVANHHCGLHQIQACHYCRFTTTVAPGIIDQYLRVEEYDIEGLSKAQAKKLAAIVHVHMTDTINITHAGLELAFGNICENKKYYLQHIDVTPRPGKAGYVDLKMTYARKEDWK